MCAIGAMGAIVLLAVPPAFAQTEPIALPKAVERYVDRTNGLSLADAVRDALDRQPSLRAARAALDAARASRRQAGRRPNPSLAFDRREEPGGTDNQTMVQMSVPLELFRRPARMAVADREIETAEQISSNQVRVVVNDAKLAYGRAAAAIRDFAVAVNLAEAALREAELLRRSVDEGASAPLARDQLIVEARRLEAARLIAAGRADAGMIALRRALGLPPEAPLVLRDTLEDLAALPAAAMSNDVLERPDVLQAVARVRLAEAQVDRARAEGRVDVSLGGSFTRMDSGFPQRGIGPGGDPQRVRGTFQYVAAGATIVLPLWNRNQDGVAAAGAQRVEAEALLAASELTARSEIAEASARVKHTREAIAVMAESVVLARKNVDTVRETYELGRATAADALVEQRRYLDTENEYTRTLLEAFEARAAYEFARGELQ
jgi:cobalt-zinc-cadmium efflux system outer membrane protein